MNTDILIAVAVTAPITLIADHAFGITAKITSLFHKGETKVTAETTAVESAAKAAAEKVTSGIVKI